MIQLWGEAVRSIEPKVKPAQRDQWLRPIECLGISDDGRIRLRAPNRYHKEWFEDNFLPSILQDLETRASRAFAVDFEIEESVNAPLNDPPAPQLRPGLDTDFAATESARPTPSVNLFGRNAPAPRSLDQRYTFDRFVVGPTNQFAHAAARMVAEAPGSKWNPLFVYGGVGLGKTHLLHAIGREIWREHPDWKIVCVSCERFVTEFIGAMTSGKRQGGVSLMEDFRRKYREEPDVLLIDDIQFLSNKDSSQDEFFHTFNALHHAHKQIVLTCDKLPGELPGLEDRLRSRFTWGLIAEIGQPDLETRVAILKRKAENEGLVLSDDVALYMGGLIKSNVRELEGALTRLFARASFEGRVIDKSMAEEALRNFLPSTPQSLSIEAIQREVASYFAVKLADLKGPNRHRAVAHPRMIAMYLARRLTSMSFPAIGSRFSGRDHSTVISAVRKIERLVETDPAQRSVINTIESHLRQS
ncbi:MAG TPA: chromosomal replication initiator protein DnaA [Polyangia bacterium]